MTNRREDAIDAVGWAVLGIMLLSCAGALLYDRWEIGKAARVCREGGGQWVAVNGKRECVGADH
jgi:hypothetical protein